MNIWKMVSDDIFPGVLTGELIRVVESQEQIATSQLVDNLQEQIQLEELLEQSKPDILLKNISSSEKRKKESNIKRLSYLLSTPFRYPPLIHGSRFGSRFESSLFYASKTKTTAFAETAFYRFYFWLGMTQSPPSEKYITEHTVFTASYYSPSGISLNKKPFKQFEGELTDPCHYKITQTLGKELRNNGIEIIEYISARDCNKGINIALFTPAALSSKKPKEQQQWLCETTKDRVSFSSKEGELFTYSLDSFLVESIFPHPAL